MFIPTACWIAAVLWKRPPRPFTTVVVIGAIYGLFLAIGHQLLWDAAFAGHAPTLGGSLAGIDSGAQEIAVRVASVLFSLVTGTLVGVVAAAVALLLGRVLPAPHTGQRSGSAPTPVEVRSEDG